MSFSLIMALRGRFIAFIGFLAGLASTIGCSNVDYLLNSQSKPSKQVDALDYADDLRDERLDKKFTTSHEERFEKLYPNLDLKGEVENLNKYDINALIDVLQKMPQDSIKKIGNYDIVLAMPLYKNKDKVNYEDLEEEAYCDYGNKEITFFSFKKSFIYHEFAHAIHFNHPRREELEEEWNNIEIMIEGKKRKLKNLYEDKTLVQEDPDQKANYIWKKDKRINTRYGFVSPYGANNICEDIATVVEFIMSNNYFREHMDKKVKILKKYGFITKNIYDTLKCKKNVSFSP